MIMAHIIIRSVRVCTDMGGAYGGRWASDGVRATRQTL